MNRDGVEHGRLLTELGAYCQIGAWPEAEIMLRRAAGLGVAPASYQPVGDALAEAALAEMRPLCRAAERWAGLGTHGRDALVRLMVATVIIFASLDRDSRKAMASMQSKKDQTKVEFVWVISNHSTVSRVIGEHTSQNRLWSRSCAPGQHAQNPHKGIAS